MKHNTLHPRVIESTPERDPLELFVQGALSFAMYLILAVAVALFLFTIAGCTPSELRLAAQGTVASNGLAQNLDTAHAEIKTAVPHTDAIGREHLNSADAAIASGEQKIPAINAGLAQVAPLKAKNQKLENQFWSPRQRALGLWIGIATLVLLVVGCYFASYIGTPIGVAAGWVFHFVTAAIPKAIHVVVSKIEANVTKAKKRLILPPVPASFHASPVPTSTSPTPATPANPA